MKDRVAEDDVEALVVEGQLLGLGGDGLQLETERSGGLAQPREHPRRYIGGDDPPDDSELHQVEREVAGSRADLEAVAEAGGVDSPQRLGELRAHLRLAAVAEVDAPLGVVFVGRGVVVSGIDVLDVGGTGARRGWHRAQNNTVPPWPANTSRTTSPPACRPSP
jgi:hypothetical protein